MLLSAIERPSLAMSNYFVHVINVIVVFCVLVLGFVIFQVV